LNYIEERAGRGDKVGEEGGGGGRGGEEEQEGDRIWGGHAGDLVNSHVKIQNPYASDTRKKSGSNVQFWA